MTLAEPVGKPCEFFDSASRWDLINPTVTTRLWEVSCGNYGGGIFECFWFKKNALKYIERAVLHGAWESVSLLNNWTRMSVSYKHRSQ